MQAVQPFIQTLLLQAMALYIHGPLRCKDLLGRIPNPHSRPLWQRRSTHPARTLMHAANAPRRGDHARISRTPSTARTPTIKPPGGIPRHTQHTPTWPRSDTQPPTLEAVQHPQPHTIRPPDSTKARPTIKPDRLFLLPAAHQPRRMSTETRCTLASPTGKAGASSLDTATGSISARSDGAGIASPSRCAARR